MSESRFNFIIGIGRSGTTLLMSLLNAHSAIQATPEINFFCFFYNSWKNKKSFTDKDFKIVYSYVQLFKRKNHASGFDWSMELFKENIKKSETISFEVIYQCFYKSFLYANKIKNFIHNFDKNPINTLFLEDICVQMPNAKFVLLVRDPRANYLSRKEKVNFRVPNIYSDSCRWIYYNKSAINFMKKYKDKIYVLKYEDLVSNPKFYLNELSVFFDFTNEENMLNFHLNVKENSLKRVTGDSASVKVKEKYEKLSNPINTDRLDAWKTKLRKDEIELISNICNVVDYFGYDLIRNRIKYNYFKYYWGIFLAKREIIKDRIVYRLPLQLKLKISNLFRR